MSMEVKLSADVSATDRYIYYDPTTLDADYPPAIDFIGELIAVGDEVMEIVGTPAPGSSPGYLVNRGVWFTTPQVHSSDQFLRVIDVHRTSMSAYPGALIELFEFDASNIGDTSGVYRFVNGFQTTRALTDLLENQKKKELDSVWTKHGPTMTVTANELGYDGNPVGYRLEGETNAQLSTFVTIPDDAQTYRLITAIQPMGVVGIEVAFVGGDTPKTYSLAIYPDGRNTTGSDVNYSPINVFVEGTESKFYMVEFEVQNNATGNTSLVFNYYIGYNAVDNPLSGEIPLTIGKNTPAAVVQSPQIFGPPGMVYWGGNVYTPLPIATSGFEQSTRGALPTPHIKVANGIVGNVIANLIDAFDDLVGAKITRYRTYAKHLDNGAEPDRFKHFRPDSFVINRKVSQNKLLIEWELSTAIDQQGMLLPARTLLRDYCPWQYRRYKTDGFTEALWASESDIFPDRPGLQIVMPSGGDDLVPGDNLFSPDGNMELLFQMDGNIVIKQKDGELVWSLATNGLGGVRLSMQTDGNLVLYTSANDVVFQSDTTDHPGAYLVLQNDGNLVVYTNSGFDYTNVECPYTGTAMFDDHDNVTTDPKQDHCSKHLTGCVLRFGAGNELPFGAFPGVSLWR